MKRMYFDVVDCEHEGDAQSAINDLVKISNNIQIVRVEYAYEDDDDPDADHEICGCCIVFDCPKDDVYKFRKVYG